jgi:hypothetical protein
MLQGTEFDRNKYDKIKEKENILIERPNEKPVSVKGDKSLN